MKIDMIAKGSGKSPIFGMRIAPELKEQFEFLANKEGLSLANWFKALGKAELERQGITPKE
ncbi:toxin-antitoxin system HicB family antitoxin [Citrobacter freundii]